MSSGLLFYDPETQIYVIIPSPTPEQVINAVQTRHYEKCSTVKLFSRKKLPAYPDKPVNILRISPCTRDRYFICHQSAEYKGRPRDVINKNVVSKERAVRYRSGNGEFFTIPFKKTVDLETALRIALHFAETDGFPDDLTWDREFK
jgi:hypothetical protein